MPNAVLMCAADNLRALLVLSASRGSPVLAVGVAAAVGAELGAAEAPGAVVVTVAVAGAVGAGVAPKTSALHSSKSRHPYSSSAKQVARSSKTVLVMSQPAPSANAHSVSKISVHSSTSDGAVIDEDANACSVSIQLEHPVSARHNRDSVGQAMSVPELHCP